MYCASTTCPKLMDDQPQSEFYKGRKVCKTCCKKRQRGYQKKYQKSEKGKATNLKYRTSHKGLVQNLKSVKRYAGTPHGAAIREKVKALKYVNQSTLKEGLHFPECDTCAEFLGTTTHDCSVVLGAESITVCEVYQNWKHSGVHPLHAMGY